MNHNINNKRNYKPTTTTSSSIQNSSNTTTTNNNNNNSSVNAKRYIAIGGPNTWMPFWLESFLCWILALCCLSVSWYHWMKQQRQSKQQCHNNNHYLNNNNNNNMMIPLTTYTYRELTNFTLYERCIQFQNVLLQLLLKEENEDNKKLVVVADDDDVLLDDISDLQLIRLIRSNSILRRLATLIIVHSNNNNNDDDDQRNVEEASTTKLQFISKLTTRLKQIWIYLIPLPSLSTTTQLETTTKYNNNKYEISVIIPTYNENINKLQRKIQIASNMAIMPQHIEIIVVDGSSSSLSSKTTSKPTNLTSTSSLFQNGNSSIIEIKENECNGNNISNGNINSSVDNNHNNNSNKGTNNVSSNNMNNINKFGFANITYISHGIGGRGPCLNLGSKYSQGHILTFLHADTKLSKGWDIAIRNIFNNSSSTTSTNSDNNQIKEKKANNNDDDGNEYEKNDATIDDDQPRNGQNRRVNVNTTTKTMMKKKIANSCAFSFAIDDDDDDYIDNNKMTTKECIPGINAIEVTANLRTHWFSLPYGDQCISIPKYIFDYVGGYPDQCIMEDYELVKLLRLRAGYATTGVNQRRQQVNNDSTDSKKEEGQKQLEEEIMNIMPSEQEEEYLAILNEKAYCSPRRWSSCGVLYVTYMNSNFVTQYSRGDLSADELFQIYYQCPNKPPPRLHPTLSPWEIELDEILNKKKTKTA